MNKFKTIIYIFLSIFLLFVNQKVESSTISIVPSNNSIGKSEQFYVDILLDTEGKTVNGIEGSVNFSKDSFSFVRAEEGKSMVNLWIQKPVLNNETLEFSGIMPNGFSGVIDPFNPDNKLPGLIVRLIFEGKNEGNSLITTSKFLTTLNDGAGTLENILDSNIAITVSGVSNNYIYKTKNDETPELTANIIRDPNLYNNKYVLVYEAKDSLTGIKEVLIKEGRRPWKKIESPYLLEDQSRHSIISIQATNYSDSSIVINIDQLPYKLFSFWNIYVSILIILIIASLFFIKKRYEKYK